MTCGVSVMAIITAVTNLPLFIINDNVVIIIILCTYTCLLTGLTIVQNTFYYRPSTLEEAYVATYDRQPPIRSKSKTVSVADLLSTEYPSEFAIVYLKSNLS